MTTLYADAAGSHGVRLVGCDRPGAVSGFVPEVMNQVVALLRP